MNRKASSVNKSENSGRRPTLLKTIVLAVTIAVCFCSSQSNAYPLHSGEYAFMQNMPDAPQVLADMKGANDLDTAARQHAALVLLIALVNVSADGTGQIPWPARERQLISAYNHALPDFNGHRDEIQAESLQLQANDSFVQTFLKRYFSEAELGEIKPMISDFEARAQSQIGTSQEETTASTASSTQMNNDFTSSTPPARDAIAQPSNAPLVNSSDAAAATGFAACGGFFVLYICIIGAIIALNVALLIWVARDARNRGMDSPVIWMVVVLLTSWVGLLIYLFTRPKGNLIPCPSCNNKRLVVSAKCPHCGNA